MLILEVVADHQYHSSRPSSKSAKMSHNQKVIAAAKMMYIVVFRCRKAKNTLWDSYLSYLVSILPSKSFCELSSNIGFQFYPNSEGSFFKPILQQLCFKEFGRPSTNCMFLQFTFGALKNFYNSFFLQCTFLQFIKTEERQGDRALFRVLYGPILVGKPLRNAP